MLTFSLFFFPRNYHSMFPSFDIISFDVFYSLFFFDLYSLRHFFSIFYVRCFLVGHFFFRPLLYITRGLIYKNSLLCFLATVIHLYSLTVLQILATLFLFAYRFFILPWAHWWRKHYRLKRYYYQDTASL